MKRQELVEKMVNSCFGTEDSGLERMCEFGAARCMLSVILSDIRENVGEYAELCECTKLALATGIDASARCRCKGTGVALHVEKDTGVRSGIRR